MQEIEANCRNEILAKTIFQYLHDIMNYKGSDNSNAEADGNSVELIILIQRQICHLSANQEIALAYGNRLGLNRKNIGFMSTI